MSRHRGFVLFQLVFRMKELRLSKKIRKAFAFLLKVCLEKTDKNGLKLGYTEKKVRGKGFPKSQILVIWPLLNPRRTNH